MSLILNGVNQVPTEATSPGGEKIASSEFLGGPAYTSGKLRVVMDNAADVSGGGTTQTIGLTVFDPDNIPITEAVTLQIAAYDDADYQTLAAAAQLGSESQGTILSAEPLNTLNVRTDAAGRFQCILTNPSDTQVWITCDEHPGGPDLDCRSFDDVTFSA